MPYRKTKFHIDGSDDIFEGYTNGKVWNGWECPFFTKPVMEKIVAWLNEDDYTKAEYVMAADTVVVMTEDKQDAEEYPGIDIYIDCVPVHVYPIGAGAWVWDEYDD